MAYQCKRCDCATTKKASPEEVQSALLLQFNTKKTQDFSKISKERERCQCHQGGVRNKICEQDWSNTTEAFQHNHPSYPHSIHLGKHVLPHPLPCSLEVSTRGCCHLPTPPWWFWEGRAAWVQRLPPRTRADSTRHKY